MPPVRRGSFTDTGGAVPSVSCTLPTDSGQRNHGRFHAYGHGRRSPLAGTALGRPGRGRPAGFLHAPEIGDAAERAGGRIETARHVARPSYGCRLAPANAGRQPAPLPVRVYGWFLAGCRPG